MMEIVTDLDSFVSEQPCAVAIGKFDGVHLGHRELLYELIRQRKNGMKAAVLTFDPSPEAFFAGNAADYKELTTMREKIAIFGRMGIDLLIEFPMNERTASTPPEAFVRDILKKKLNAGFVAAGEDLSFGDRGAGNFELLRSLAPALSYEAKMIEKVRYQGDEISSTRIRTMLERAQMEDVTACLGHPYTISGTVTPGRRLGRTIGVPTLNLVPETGKMLPPFGVYYSAVRVYWNGAGDPTSKSFRGVTNIGMRPTVQDLEGVRDRAVVETHLYDFDQDLYGTDIDVSLLKFVRPEQPFPDLEALRLQMEQDVQGGRAFFGLDEEDLSEDDL